MQHQSASNYHIRALRHIRRHISENAAMSIACSMIYGQLDYCNSVLHRPSASNIIRVWHAGTKLYRPYYFKKTASSLTASNPFWQISTICQSSTESSISSQ